MGEATLAELDAVGAAYDAAWSLYGDTLTSRESAWDDALDAWLSTGTGVTFSNAWSDALAVAKYAEHVLYLARAPIALTPRVVLAPTGERFALTEHSLSLPSTTHSGWVNPLVATRASRTLLTGGSAPVLRVTARDDGLAGNAVRVAVQNASSGRATECAIVITRGTGATAPHTETYDNLDLTAAGVTLPDVSDSPLLLSIEHVGLGRPANLSASVLTGGAGLILEAMTRRLDTLVALARTEDSPLTVTDQRTLLGASSLLTGLWSAIPVLVSPPALQSAEDLLVAAKARAVSATALIASIYPS